MKATRKLIPALAMLLVAAVVMSTASYAWFTMSREVSANSMDVTVSAPNNLLIKNHVDEDTAYSAIAENAATGVQLVPTSTVNGISLFSLKDGEALAADGNLVLSKSKLQAAVAAVADTSAGGYYDFQYDVKTDGGETVDVYVKDITLTNNAASKADSIKPVRFAILNADGSAVNDGAENVLFVGDKSYTAANYESGKAVSSIDGSGFATRAAVTYQPVTGVYATDSENQVFTVPASGTPITITIRVWFEGDDTNCTIAKSAGADFTLGVKLADVDYNPGA